VLVHRSFVARRPEPRFYTTLDREIRSVFGVPHDVAPSGPVEGWVFIAPVAAVPATEWEALTAERAIRIYDEFIMVDFRRRERGVLATSLEEEDPSWTWWLLNSPFEPPVVERRDWRREAAWAGHPAIQ
jgi:hypothetical protein